MAGIYLHIPFCRKACHYCDFHFSTNLSAQERMCEAIIKELENEYGYLQNEHIETIYFGGGTPSILKEEELDSILSSNLYEKIFD